MTIYRLPEECIFPSPELAEDNGLLAIDGDLSEKRLLTAYSMGIFPWYSEGDPILWWSPDPRLVLFPNELKVARSMKQTMNKDTFTVTMDKAFEEVIRHCSTIHRKNDGDTWITGEMIDGYVRLHKSGFAHSVEAWSGGELAGGLYGVSLGSVFFGESMFTKHSNASKVAFINLVDQLGKWSFSVIDCQITTPHLQTLGACEIPRSNFLDLVKDGLSKPTRKGRWEFMNTIS